MGTISIFWITIIWNEEMSKNEYDEMTEMIEIEKKWGRGHMVIKLLWIKKVFKKSVPKDGI